MWERVLQIGEEVWSSYFCVSHVRLGLLRQKVFRTFDSGFVMTHYHNINSTTTTTTTSLHNPRPKTTNIYADIVKAEQRIRKYLAPTPLIYSPYFSAIVNSKLSSGHSNPCRVFLKLESENVTGSFKVRGAFNKVLISKEKGTFSAGKLKTAKFKPKKWSPNIRRKLSYSVLL